MFVVVSGFFQWMDKPKCGRCNVEGQTCGYLPPLEDEERWGAARVEGYICPRCGQDMRFPRYNHPGKLLGKLNHPLFGFIYRIDLKSWTKCLGLFINLGLYSTPTILPPLPRSKLQNFEINTFANWQKVISTL